MNSEQAHKLGEILKTRRDELGLSTYKLAGTAGIDQATVVRLENGAFTAPRPDKLARVAEALDLSAADLFAMAGYTTPHDLPALPAYLHVKYCDLPQVDLDSIEAFVADVAARRAVDLNRSPDQGARL